jgi:hypothetical protein
MERQDVYKTLDQERAYQGAKWGDLDSRNSLGDFLIYLNQRLQAAIVAYGGPGNEAASIRYVQQVGALAVAAMEKFGAPGRPTGGAA